MQQGVLPLQYGTEEPHRGCDEAIGVGGVPGDGRGNRSWRVDQTPREAQRGRVGLDGQSVGHFADIAESGWWRSGGRPKLDFVQSIDK